jgi:type I restriction enzyme S subunit
MREGWTRVALGDVAEIVGGGTPKTSEPSYWSGSIPWITPTEVVAAEGKVITSTARTITDLGLQKSGARLLPPSSVLVTSRATVGAVAITGCAMATNQGFAAFIAGPLALPEFLMIWCQANAGEFRMRAGGSTFPEISRGVVREIPIDLPPLDEQRRIVDLIGSLDSQLFGLANLTAASAEVGVAAAAAAWTMGAPMRPLSSLGRLVTGSTPRTSNPAFWEPADVPFVTPGDFNGMLLDRACRSISDAGARTARRIPVGSVLQVCIGSIGKTAVSGVEVCTNQQVNALVGLESDDAFFAAGVLDAPQGRRVLAARAARTTLPIIKKSAWGSLEIPWPDAAVRQRTGKIIASAAAVRNRALAADRAAAGVRRALLRDLLSGSRRIPVSYDDLLTGA